MNFIQIENWKEYQQDGEQFLRVASKAFIQRKKAFSTETLYNLICMGIEKLIMAFLMSRGDLAENHTMGDLYRALENHLGPIPHLKSQMGYLDKFQEICDLDTFNLQKPTRKDIQKMMSIGEEIQGVLSPLMPPN